LGVLSKQIVRYPLFDLDPGTVCGRTASECKIGFGMLSKKVRDRCLGRHTCPYGMHETGE